MALTEGMKLEFCVAAGSNEPTAFVEKDGVRYWLEDSTAPSAIARDQARRFAPYSKEIIVAGMGLGYRVKALVEAGCYRPIVYEPDERLRSATELRFGEFTSQAIVCSRPEQVLSYLSQRPGDNFGLMVTETYARLFKPELEDLFKRLAETEGFRKVRKATGHTRGQEMIRRAMLNTRNLWKYPNVSKLGPEFTKGCPAIIVGAGPSLDKNIEQLRGLFRSHLIFAASTSSRALLEAGCPIDFLLSIEPMSQREVLEDAEERMRWQAFDVVTNPDNIVSDRGLFFIGAHGWARPIHQISRRHYTKPLVYGPNVGSAAVSLAAAWGCRKVILVGFDAAYTGGNMYAQGTGRGDWTINWDPKRAMVAFNRGDQQERMDELFRSVGATGAPKEVTGYEVTAWGGDGTEVTTHDIAIARGWLENWARGFGKKVKAYNCTEGGAQLKGWREVPLATAVTDTDRVIDRERQDELIDAAPAIPTRKVDRWRSNMRMRAMKVASLANRGLAALGDRRKVDRVAEELRIAAARHPFVDALATPKFFEIVENEMIPPHERPKPVFEAVRDAAKTVAECFRD